MSEFWRAMQKEADRLQREMRISYTAFVLETGGPQEAYLLRHRGWVATGRPSFDVVLAERGLAPWDGDVLTLTTTATRLEQRLGLASGEEHDCDGW